MKLDMIIRLQEKLCCTSGFNSTTIAQMPNGIPTIQHGPTMGMLATTAAAKANRYKEDNTPYEPDHQLSLLRNWTGVLRFQLSDHARKDEKKIDQKPKCAEHDGDRADANQGDSWRVDFVMIRVFVDGRLIRIGHDV
jgi:hypothetical protein